MKKIFITFFKSKRVNIFLLFVALALLFSLLTKLSSDYTKTVKFNIKPINVPEDKIIIADTLHQLNLTLETYGFKYISLYFNNPELEIDFSKLDKTGKGFLWLERKHLSQVVSQLDSKIKIKAISPDTLYFEYDINFVKYIPVELVHNITYSPGFDIINTFKLQPDSIKVIGPEKIIDTITTLKTKPLILENVKASISKELPLELSEDYRNIKFSDSKIKVEASVEKFTEGSVEVPIILKNVPQGININYYPKTVNVLFFTSLSNYKTINEEDFIVECDFSALKNNNSFLIPELKQQPEYIKNLRIQTKKVEFIIIK